MYHDYCTVFEVNPHMFDYTRQTPFSTDRVPPALPLADAEHMLVVGPPANGEERDDAISLSVLLAGAAALGRLEPGGFERVMMLHGPGCFQKYNTLTSSACVPLYSHVPQASFAPIFATGELKLSDNDDHRRPHVKTRGLSFSERLPEISYLRWAQTFDFVRATVVDELLWWSLHELDERPQLPSGIGLADVLPGMLLEGTSKAISESSRMLESLDATASIVLSYWGYDHSFIPGGGTDPEFDEMLEEVSAAANIASDAISKGRNGSGKLVSMVKAGTDSEAVRDVMGELLLDSGAVSQMNLWRNEDVELEDVLGHKPQVDLDLHAF